MSKKVHALNADKRAPDGHCLALCGFKGAGEYMRERGWYVVDCATCLKKIRGRGVKLRGRLDPEPRSESGDVQVLQETNPSGHGPPPSGRARGVDQDRSRVQRQPGGLQRDLGPFSCSVNGFDR